ncbi:GDSL esterase/lipase At4g10955-like [Silene latifolia]|uniref:GDSL esterase/lipase At4g10955-like n=1 Tax=Silene latifolia TaxID=37657 RepID=UPI003D773414
MEEDGKEIPSKWEVFGVSGPLHLTSVDWGIQDHKRTIAASLVQGVYISQRDRNLNRTDPHKAQAPKWWQFFNFQPIQFLTDPFDHSNFGAIYAYQPLHSNPKQRDNRPATSSQSVPPPSHVIAFRGTLLKPETRQRDIYLDMNLPLKGLPYDPRYHRAVQAVLWLIGQVDYKSVWLTGHSLGAAIALQVGKDLAKKGTYIETFLFNPPYHSAPVERIQNPFLKTRIRVAKSLITAGLSVAFKSNKDDYTPTPKNDPFNLLCSWVPNVFVNPRDPISCEYIGYFEHRDRMEAMGMGKIGNIATKNSIMNYLSGMFGRDGEPPHLVPSALLIKNMNFSEPNVMVAHGIHQWWQPHSWMSKLHIFSECNCPQ